MKTYPSTPIRSATSTTSATESDGTIKCSGTITVYLPTFAPGGLTLTIKNVGTGVIIIDGNGATIDGASTKQLTAQWQSYSLQYDGSAWFIL